MLEMDSVSETEELGRDTVIRMVDEEIGEKTTPFVFPQVLCHRFNSLNLRLSISWI